MSNSLPIFTSYTHVPSSPDPLSNYLHLLSEGKPGGHQKCSFLDTSELNSAYANVLASIGKTDTLIAILEFGD